MYKDWVQSAIAYAPTLAPLYEWIDAKKCLPPEYAPVVCIVSGKPRTNITLERAYQIGSWNSDDGWIIDEWSDWENANVLYWMLIAEPPGRRPPERQEDT